MAAVRVEFQCVSKRFSGRPIFSGISGTVLPGRVLVVAGPNGSGKSTLLNLLAGQMRPSGGTVRYVTEDGGEIARPEWFTRIGVAAPDMNLYDELTGMENLLLFARLRRIAHTCGSLVDLAERFGVPARDLGRPVGDYSSGMKQRLKLAQALLHDPAVVLFDEPGSNLDTRGHELLAAMVVELRSRSAVAVATNDPRELAWADETVELPG